MEIVVEVQEVVLACETISDRVRLEVVTRASGKEVYCRGVLYQLQVPVQSRLQRWVALEGVSEERVGRN